MIFGLHVKNLGYAYEPFNVYFYSASSDNTMTKGKRTKRQPIIFKTLHRQQNIEQHEPS